MVDSQGLLLSVLVHSAAIVDHVGGPMLLWRAGLQRKWPRLEVIYADGGDGGSIKSQIVELGWDPGAMAACGYTQDSTWAPGTPPPNPSGCDSHDGLPHRFEQDVRYILQNQRHNAEAVTVWIIRGWSDAADGIHQNGTSTNWFSQYQLSNP